MTIKEIRELSGLTQKAFAEKYGIPRRTLEDWERKNKEDYILNWLEFVVRYDYGMLEK